MRGRLKTREKKPQYEGSYLRPSRPLLGMHSSKLCCSRSLSEPTFLPIAGDKTSGTDSEQETASQRKVRFSRVAEVNNIPFNKAGFISICVKLLFLQSYHF